MSRLLLLLAFVVPQIASAQGPGGLRAGVASVAISARRAIPEHEPLFAKALVLKTDTTTAVLVTLDAVAVGEIGPIGNDYLGKVRARLQRELGLAPGSLIVNASHCHGLVGPDVDAKTVEAVKTAMANLAPVTVGVGVGREERVSENRRLRLKSGHEADVRHAYSLPPDSAVAAVGPIDPQIGILRLDKADGQPLAIVYNFACHPILGVNGDGDTADLAGYASRVVEDAYPGATALFVQGCGGDINPIRYKDVNHPRHAETLGNRLGLAVVRAARTIRTAKDAPLVVMNEMLALPRADHTERIDKLEAEWSATAKSLKGTTLNLKTFLELVNKHGLSKEFPSYDSHLYLTELAAKRADLTKLDEANRRNVQAYVDNVLAMERMTILRTNIALLRKHAATNRAAGGKPIEAEVAALRVGEFRLVTFPGELTVEIGLAIKKASPHPSTFVAGYTNGYLYYTPTARQLRNPGAAQEDCDTLVAPEWERLFLDRIAVMLKKL